MPDLIIFRGLPGAGKTTVATVLVKTVFSADDYFYDENGEYRFCAEKLAQAHALCRGRTEEALALKVSPVGVANTFTTDEEIGEYERLASQYGYRFHSLVVENRHGNESKHGVPEKSRDEMKIRFKLKL